MGWILNRAKASKKAKALRMLINAETPISPSVAIDGEAEEKGKKETEKGKEEKQKQEIKERKRRRWVM